MAGSAGPGVVTGHQRGAAATASGRPRVRRERSQVRPLALCVPTSDLAALLTGYLQECAKHGGTAPTAAGLDPFLPWTPQAAPAVVPPVTSARAPARNPDSRTAGP